MCALFLTCALYSAGDFDVLVVCNRYRAHAMRPYVIINHNDCMEMIRHDYIHIELNIKIIQATQKVALAKPLLHFAFEVFLSEDHSVKN